MGKKKKKKRSSEKNQEGATRKYLTFACMVWSSFAVIFNILKKQIYLWFSSRTEESSWIIKVCVKYFKTVLIDAYGPNIETTKFDNITYSSSNQT